MATTSYSPPGSAPTSPHATATGDFARVLTGIIVMSIYVVGVNRLVWRRLYRLAETRFTLYSL